MRHYEIIFLIHPDQSEQVPDMLEKYKTQIESKSGHVHWKEDWGRRHLAYPIKKVLKAHYILLNIEVDQPTLSDLEQAFRFNDAIIRFLVVSREQARTTHSGMLATRARIEDDRTKRPYKSHHSRSDQTHASTQRPYSDQSDQSEKAG